MLCMRIANALTTLCGCESLSAHSLLVCATFTQTSRTGKYIYDFPVLFETSDCVQSIVLSKIDENGCKQTLTSLP